jgi:hypothetical protein
MHLISVYACVSTSRSAYNMFTMLFIVYTGLRFMHHDEDLFVFQECYENCYVPFITNKIVHIFCYNKHNFIRRPPDWPLAPIVCDHSEARKIQKTAGIVCRLAAVFSTTAMRHQYWAQHEYVLLNVASQKMRILYSVASTAVFMCFSRSLKNI